MSPVPVAEDRGMGGCEAKVSLEADRSWEHRRVQVFFGEKGWGDILPSLISRTAGLR